MISYPAITKARVNLGALPYFDCEDDQGRRNVKFHEDQVIERFPRVLSQQRVTDALEINLFLEHRYKGLFNPPKRSSTKNIFGGVSLSTLNSIANSMLLFLQWIESNNVDWHDVYAESGSDKAKYWLPVYRYRKHLINQVVDQTLDRDSANLYINHVRQFYEWARKQRRVEKLPFVYKTKVITKKRKDGELDLLFSGFPLEKRGFVITTSDLAIPKKYKQKKPDHAQLKPFDQEELKALYECHELTKQAIRLRVDLACQCGLRADEVATFPADQVVDPATNNQCVYYVDIIGKYDKARTIMVSSHLMQALWSYRNGKEYLQRLNKWQMHTGSCNNAPLFLNRSGKAITAKSVGNVISKVRAELSERDMTLKRSFHDLRSTFATNLAAFLLSKNLPIGFIQFKLMKLLGHNDFSTTQKYIHFARSLTFDKQMASWVDKLFGEFIDPLKESAFTTQQAKDDNA